MRVFALSYEHDAVVRGDMGGHGKIWELADHLFRLGHLVTVFAPRLEDPRRGTQVEVVEVPCVEIPLLRPLTVYLSLFLYPLVRARRQRPDVLYVRTLHSPLPALLGKLLSVPLVVEVNGDSYAQLKMAAASPLKRALIKWIDGINVACADRVIAITRGLQRMLGERYGIPLERTAVIASGSNVDLFKAEDTAACRARLGLAPTGSCVGFLGTFFRYQGIDTLIEAAPRILERFPDTRFLIVGDGVMRAPWQRTVAARGLERAFLFPGRVPYTDAPRYINATDVCVAPFLSSRGETSPLKLFDYLACGKPVVVSDIPSVREIIGEERGVVAIPPESPEALADAVIGLLADEGRRRLLGENGRRFVVAEHSWERIAQQVAALCQGAIDARRGRRERAAGGRVDKVSGGEN